MEERNGLLDKVILGAEQVSRMYYRLLVVVSNDEARGGRYIAEGLGIPRVNVGEKLARRLFGLLKRLYKSMFKSKRRIAVTVLIWAVVTVAVWMLVW